MKTFFLTAAWLCLPLTASAADSSFLDLIRLNIGQPLHITEGSGKSLDGKLIEVGGDYLCAELSNGSVRASAEKRCYPAIAVKSIAWRKQLQDPKIVVDKL